MRPVTELAQAWEARPLGERPAALREGAQAFRARFRAGGRVRAVRTAEVGSAQAPVGDALGGAARALRAEVTLADRLVLVAFDGFGGEPLLLAWRPGGELQAALDRCGLSADAVTHATFDHLHGVDAAAVMAQLPSARLVVQRPEADAVAAPHPLQRPWYAAQALDGVDVEALDGDVELGEGVALLRTPGHTAGHQSLALNTSDGVWVVSGNGVAADSWQPHISRMPGVRAFIEEHGHDVVPDIAGSESIVDQHDAMLLEKAIADAHPDDPRWAAILPSRELVASRRAWPVAPTFTVGGIHLGRLP